MRVTFPNVTGHCVLLQKNSVRPTVSASKNLNYSPQRKSGEGSNRRIHHPPSPAPYSEKHLLAACHWFKRVTVLYCEKWLVRRAVHSRWRHVRCRCGNASVAGQCPLQDKVTNCHMLEMFFIIFLFIYLFSLHKIFHSRLDFSTYDLEDLNFWYLKRWAYYIYYLNFLNYLYRQYIFLWSTDFSDLFRVNWNAPHGLNSTLLQVSLAKNLA